MPTHPDQTATAAGTARISSGQDRVAGLPSDLPGGEVRTARAGLGYDRRLAGTLGLVRAGGPATNWPGELDGLMPRDLM